MISLYDLYRTHLLVISLTVLIAALLMAMSLLWRRLAIPALVLAIVLPVLFLCIGIFASAATTGAAYTDIVSNYGGAMALYRDGTNPFQIDGAISFPFPTFYIYWLASGFGGSLVTTWAVLSAVSMGLWAISAYLLISASDEPKDRLLTAFACTAIPAAMVISQGQTMLIVTACMVVLHFALQSVKRGGWVIGGGALAVAMLIKPQIALVGAGILLWWMFTRRDTAKVVTVVMASVVVAGGLIALTLLMPGGVEWQHYAQFFREVLPTIGNKPDQFYNGAFPYFVSQLLGSATAGTITTLGIIAAAVWWTYQRRDQKVAVIAAGLVVWAALATVVAWSTYIVWALPFVALELRRAYHQGQTPRAMLILVVIGSLNWQPPVQAYSTGTLFLLLILLWTSLPNQTKLSPTSGTS